MKLEKITDDKFKSFAGQQVAYSQAVYGGYKGETSTGSQSDQIKGDSSVDYTENPSGVSNDGFK